MSNEETKKPEWLDDLQKGDFKRLNLDEDELNLDGNLVKNVSVRYGRRTSACAKSVENSPTKDSLSVKDKRNCISARPLLTYAETVKGDGKKDEEANNLNKSIKLLEESLQRSLNVETPEISKTNLEDSWNSLHFFNIKQKGRLNSGDNLTKNKSKKKSFKSSNKYLVPEQVNNNDVDQSNASLIDFEIDVKEENFKESLINVEYEKTDFIIPELPKGQLLVFNIKTTWGDKHYLGLNGIEMFNADGEKIKVKAVSILMQSSECRKSIDNICLSNQYKIFKSLQLQIYIEMHLNFLVANIIKVNNNSNSFAFYLFGIYFYF